VLQTAAEIFTTDDGMSWKTGKAKHIVWSSAQVLPVELSQRYAGMLAPGLSLQRILLDVHSGRIFGRYGALFVDLLGLALLTLA